MAVIDLISKGRVSYIVGVGYRPAEFEMFGQSFPERGRRLEASVKVLQQAWTGEPFEYEGRVCRVTPKPFTPGGPMLFMGGGTPAAVRRAVRLGIGMLTERSDDLSALYERECEAAGVEPQMFVETPNDTITSAFVATDPDRFWDQIGDHVLSEVRSYREWNAGRGLPASTTDRRHGGRAAGQRHPVPGVHPRGGGGARADRRLPRHASALRGHPAGGRVDQPRAGAHGGAPEALRSSPDLLTRRPHLTCSPDLPA